jgi:hypothetical protein
MDEGERTIAAWNRMCKVMMFFFEVQTWDRESGPRWDAMEGLS